MSNWTTPVQDWPKLPTSQADWPHPLRFQDPQQEASVPDTESFSVKSIKKVATEGSTGACGELKSQVTKDTEAWAGSVTPGTQEGV
jgi:hypothetical protein